MIDIINKVCGQLINNPHIIGIIKNCDTSIDDDYKDNEDKRIDLCIISKEAGNQKIFYTEAGYVVCLHWRNVDEFLELLDLNPEGIKTRNILYDKTGFISHEFERACI